MVVSNLVPSYNSEWYWWQLDGSKEQDVVDFHNRVYGPDFKYAGMISSNALEFTLDFAPKFTAELFDPDEWADLFAKSGLKYIVLTSKHHEGTFFLYH